MVPKMFKIKWERIWEILSHVIIILGAVGCYASVFTLQVNYSDWIDVMTNLPDVQNVIDNSNYFDNTGNRIGYTPAKR